MGQSSNQNAFTKPLVGSYFVLHQNEKISEGRRDHRNATWTQEGGTPKTQDGSRAEYRTINSHQSKRKDESKMQASKGSETGRRWEKGKGLRHLRKKRVLYFCQKTKGDKWEQSKQGNRKWSHPGKRESYRKREYSHTQLCRNNMHLTYDEKTALTTLTVRQKQVGERQASVKEASNHATRQQQWDRLF